MIFYLSSEKPVAMAILQLKSRVKQPALSSSYGGLPVGFR